MKKFQVLAMSFSNLILGLHQFLMLHIVPDSKRISSFLFLFQSHFLNSNSTKNTDNLETRQENRVEDDRSVAGEEVKIVLRSLGMSFNAGGEAKIQADEIYSIFEEKGPGLDEVKEAFDVFDDNRDGFIDAMELHKILCALGFKEGSDVENCRRMIGVHDDNGDGRIDFDEFVKFMESSFI